MEILKISNLSKSYYIKKTEKQVLKDINFTINEGDFYGVIGYTGAGKSTLVKCLNLIEDYQKGSILFENKDINLFTKKEQREYLQKVSYIFQNPNLLQTKTVFENVSFPLKVNNYSQDSINELVNKYLDIVGLSDFKDKYPNQLSGGQKQRVAIARSLVLEPKILICDEPTSALDPKTTHQIIGILNQLQTDLNITIIFISHEFDLISKYTNKVIILENGSVVANDETKKVFADNSIEFIKYYNDLNGGK